MFDGRRIHVQSQHLSTFDVENHGEAKLAQDLHFDCLLMDFGGILGSHNEAKTLKNSSCKGINT